MSMENLSKNKTPCIWILNLNVQVSAIPPPAPVRRPDSVRAAGTVPLQPWPAQPRGLQPGPGAGHICQPGYSLKRTLCKEWSNNFKLREGSFQALNQVLSSGDTQQGAGASSGKKQRRKTRRRENRFGRRGKLITSINHGKTPLTRLRKGELFSVEIPPTPRPVVPRPAAPADTQTLGLGAPGLQNTTPQTTATAQFANQIIGNNSHHTNILSMKFRLILHIFSNLDIFSTIYVHTKCYKPKP